MDVKKAISKIDWANILTGVSCTCSVLAAVFGIKGGMAVENELETKFGEDLSLKDKVLIFAKHCWPSIVSAGISVGTGIASRRMSVKQIAAAAAVGAAGITAIKEEFNDYREAAVEVVGEEKEQEILERSFEKRLVRKEGLPLEIKAHFVDEVNDIEFDSTVGTVLQGYAHMNSLCFNLGTIGLGVATFDDFYGEIGLPKLRNNRTAHSGYAYDICDIDWETYFIEPYFERRSDGAYIIKSYPDASVDINKRLKEMEEIGVI